MMVLNMHMLVYCSGMVSLPCKNQIVLVPVLPTSPQLLSFFSFIKLSLEHREVHSRCTDLWLMNFRKALRWEGEHVARFL
jgi:hypothetical protein